MTQIVSLDRLSTLRTARPGCFLCSEGWGSPMETQCWAGQPISPSSELQEGEEAGLEGRTRAGQQGLVGRARPGLLGRLRVGCRRASPLF